MFALITTFYNEKNLNRRNEFLQVIKYNVENRHLIKVYILCESGEEFITGIDSKIEIIKQAQRPKFQDLIKVANQLSSNIIKIIANTDIYFNESLIKAKELKTKHVYCLTRWDLKTTGEIEFYPNFKSQDSWIFRDTLPENIGQYFMGLPGCDNRLAAEFLKNDFKICNPSLTIRSIHLHISENRTYNKLLDRVIGGYAYCLPNYLEGEDKDLKLQKTFWLVRRKYYNAIYNKSLEGIKVNMIKQIMAYFYLNYCKLRLKSI